jgi:S-adenosylmethionine/arginine decarboxylase-like enzyme
LLCFENISFHGSQAKSKMATMSKGSAAKRQFRNDKHGDQVEGFNLLKRILQVERDQKADEARIDDAITKAESDIAALNQRHRAPEEMQRAIIAIRDRTVLIVRDVRKNMQNRDIVAKNMQETLSDDFLRQRSRFANDDIEDANLRTRFFELLERSPTYALLDYFGDAREVGNIACAESIQFEFKCREDRHEYNASFEAIVANLSVCDPVEMRKRLANIRNAAEKVDARITNLLQRVRSPQGLSFSFLVQESAMKVA